MIQVYSNMYNGNRRTTGEHDYDTIPDVLQEIQLQQMEMVSQFIHIHTYTHTYIVRALAWEARSRGFESHLRQLILL